MEVLIRQPLRRLRISLTTWPTPRLWGEAALIGALTLAAMAAIGFTGGLYHLTPPQLGGLYRRMATVLLAPALGEEALFRGPFIPVRTEAGRPWLAIGLVTVAFILWHVVEATTFLPRAAPIFLRADFLACAAALGLGAGVIRWRTGSLWPAVALHWLVVMVWQTWLGGPGLEALR